MMEFDREILEGLLTDDEDFLELVAIEAFPRKRRTFREKVDHFEKWDDKEFRERFRLSKETVRLILEEINDSLTCLKNVNSALTPATMLLSTLRYLATGNILQIVGDIGGFDKSTSRVISRVLRAIAQLNRQFIKMPQSLEKLRSVKRSFYGISRFPNCIGAIDCRHIKIQSPGGENAEIYRNRKNFFSMNVQIVCDSKLKIMDVVCRWPGSTHDSTIFSNSRMKARMENREFQNSVLVGDSGYGIKNYLLTPLRNPETRAEQIYNESQIRTRNCVERMFGVLKRRFPVLANGIRLKLEKVEAVVVTCAILHNIACDRGEPELEADEVIEEAIQVMNGINPDLPQDDNINANNFYRSTMINNYFQALL